MTSNEQLIEILRNIKTECASHPTCEGCRLKYKTSNGVLFCQIGALVDEFNEQPSQWDMEEIEKILKE